MTLGKRAFHTEAQGMWWFHDFLTGFAKIIWGLVVCFFFLSKFYLNLGVERTWNSADFGASSGNIALLNWHGCGSDTDVQSHIPCGQLSSFQCSQHTQSMHYYSNNVDHVMPYYIIDTVFRGTTLLLQRNIFKENAASAGVDLWTASVVALPWYCHLMYTKFYFQSDIDECSKSLVWRTTK